MLVAFVSDIHGNLAALDAVLADIDNYSSSLSKKGIEKVICLGDIVDLGPQPHEVLRRLRSRKIECIEGNHDPLTEEPPPVLRPIFEKNKDMLTEEDRAYLGGLPESSRVEISDDSMEALNGSVVGKSKSQSVLCVHGSPRSNTEGITANLTDKQLDEILLDNHTDDFDILVCGHTHLQMLRRWRGKTIVNVGSVGFPFRRAPAGPREPPELCPWAEYAIIESDGSSDDLRVDLRRVSYDLDAYRKATIEAFGETTARLVAI